MSILVFHAYQYNRAPITGRWPLEGTIWHDLLMDVDAFVSMFFVLSGFLLGLSYVRSVLDGGPHRYARAFLIRRAVRIVPVYYVVVLVVWSLTNPELPGDWLDLVEHLTFTQVFDPHRIFYTNGPAWSLADEIYYYLLLAVLGALAQRHLANLRSRRAKIVALLTGVSLLIMISLGYKLLALLVWRRPATDYPTWFGPLARLDAFAIGLLLAIVAGAGVRWTRRSIRWTITTGGAALLITALANRPSSEEPDPFVQPVVALGCALILSVPALTTARNPAWLRWPPLVAVGAMSYSLYLWHEPLLRMLDAMHLLPEAGTTAAFPVTAALLLPVGLVVAWLSDRVIVRPCAKIAASFDARGRPLDYYADDAMLPSARPRPTSPGPTQQTGTRRTSELD